MSVPRSRLTALACALGSYQLWTVYDVFNKLAGSALSPFQIAVESCAVIALALPLYLLATGQLGRLRIERPSVVALYVACVVCESPCAIYGAIHLPLPLFYCIYFTAPIVTVLLCHVLLGERASGRAMAASAVGFAGCALALLGRFHGAAGATVGGAFATIVGVLTISLSMTIVRWRGGAERSEAMTFSFALAMIPVASIALGLSGRAVVLDPAPNVYAALSGLAGLFGYLLNVRAYQIGPAAIVAPMHYTQMIGGVLFGWMLWHDLPEWYTAAGAALVVLAGFAIVRMPSTAA